MESGSDLFEDLLFGFEVQVRKTHWFSRSYGIVWGFWRWTPANISMVSGQLRVSDQTTTWQISPFWVERRGFTKIVVYGTDENQKRGLIVRFANVEDWSKFAESVPGLRWTYWDPAGHFEAIPVKNRVYLRPIEWVFFTVAIAAFFGLYLWVTFSPLFVGIFGILLAPFLLPVHLLSLPFGQRRKGHEKGYLLFEAGNVVLTTGNVVWFDPELSNRRIRNPRRLLVKTGKKTLLLKFADRNDTANGWRLLRKNHNLQHGMIDLTQVA